MTLLESIYSTFGKLSHRSRCAAQWVCRPELAIIGSYHGGNLGDLCLGRAVAALLSARKEAPSHALQTIYNLSSWPSTRRAIVGGGAVAYEESMANLRQRFGHRPEALVFLGVDFNDLSVIHQHADFLNQVFAITCRSEEQAAQLREVLERDDICAHPDLSFALYSTPAKEGSLKSNSRSGFRQPICGLSLPPLMFGESEKSWVLHSDFSKEILRSAPSAGGNMKVLAEAYVQFFRKACERLLQKGYALEHLAFAGEDDAFARYVLEGLPVHFNPYRRSYRFVVSKMHQQQLFLSGRFHSLAFALKERVPCLAFCYSPKSSRLLKDLKVSGPAVCDLNDAVQGISEERFSEMLAQPVLVDADQVKQAATKVRKTVNRVLDQWNP